MKRYLFCLGIYVLFLGLIIPQGAFAANIESQDKNSKKSQLQNPAPVVDESDAKRALISDYLSKGDEAGAMQALEEVISAPKYHNIKEWATLELLNRAQAKGQIPQVIANLEKGAAKNPDDVLLQRAIAEGYLRLRDFNKVISIYENLEKKNPKDYVISTRLTDYYILGKQFDKAIARLEPIVNANPDDNYHSDILLNAYIQAGMEAKAMAIFKKRLEKEGNSPGFRARYAQALQDFGRLAEAIKEWDKAYELDPSNAFFKNRADSLRLKK